MERRKARPHQTEPSGERARGEGRGGGEALIIQLDVGDLHRFQSENKSLKTFESAATTANKNKNKNKKNKESLNTRI